MTLFTWMRAMIFGMNLNCFTATDDRLDSVVK